jgi:hypothetical protein
MWLIVGDCWKKILNRLKYGLIIIRWPNSTQGEGESSLTTITGQYFCSLQKAFKHSWFYQPAIKGYYS